MEKSFEKQLIDATRTALERPERRTLPAFITFWLIIFLGAVLPVALAIWIGATLSPSETPHRAAIGAETAAAEKAADDVMRKEQIDALADRIQGLLALDLPSDPPPDLKTKAEELAAAQTVLDALKKQAAQARVPGNLVKVEKRNTALMLFWTAAILTSLLCAGVLWAQTGLAVRYWKVIYFDKLPSAGGRQDRPLGDLVYLALLALVLAYPVLALTRGDARFALWVWPFAFVALVLFGLLLQHWQRENRPVRNLQNGGWFALGLTIAVALVAMVTVFTEPGLPRPLALWSGAEPVRAVTLGAEFVLVLVLCCTVMTGFVSYCYSLDVPSRRLAMRIARTPLAKDAGRTLIDPPSSAHTVAAELWDRMQAYVKSQIIVESDDKETDQKAEPVYKPMSEAQAKFPPLPMMSGFSPGNADTLIRSLAVSLTVTMVAAMATLSLALDVLELQAGLPETLAAAVAASADTWLILLGGSLSVVLFLMCVPPLLRLDPMVEAYAIEAKNQKVPKARVWDISGRARQHWNHWAATATLHSPPQTKSDAAPPTIGETDGLDLYIGGKVFPELRILCRHLGANELKFAAILRSIMHGLAFQEFVQANLKSQFLRVLTVLAPALASSVLAFLK